MGYKIQPVQTNSAVDNTALGVEINFNGPGVFVPVYSTDQQALNNLKNLLLTRIGERYDNPAYGTNLLNIIRKIKYYRIIFIHYSPYMFWNIFYSKFHYYFCTNL